MKKIQYVGELERPKTWVMWTLRGLALLAAGVSLALAWVSLREGTTGLLGCGQDHGFDCDAVLGSRWSSVAGIPVAVPATALYSALLLGLLAVGHPGAGIGDRVLWRLVTVMAVIGAAAAAWFVGLQLLLLHSFCPYCLIVHASALMLLGLIVIYGPIHGGAFALPGVVGLLAVVGLALGQVYLGPRGYLVEPAPDSTAAAAPLAAGDEPQAPAQTQPAKPLAPESQQPLAAADQPPAPQAQAEDPKSNLSRPFLKGKLRVRPYHIPAVGPPDADRLAIELFDYTCPHCRRLYGFLKQAQQRYGITILLAPVPLNRDCNPAVPETRPMHRYACDHARLALAVWRVSPQALEPLHDWLFEAETPPTPEDAHRFAATLVDEAKLDAALQDPWIDRQIQTDLAIYRACGYGRVPKLIIQDHIVTGLPNSADELFNLFETTFGYTAVANAAP